MLGGVHHLEPAPPPLQAHNKIPDDHWEYQIRKNLNDAAYQGLDYVPYCSTMPVQAKCNDPKFIWVRARCWRAAPLLARCPCRCWCGLPTLHSADQKHPPPPAMLLAAEEEGQVD